MSGQAPWHSSAEQRRPTRVEVGRVLPGLGHPERLRVRPELTDEDGAHRRPVVVEPARNDHRRVTVRLVIIDTPGPFVGVMNTSIPSSAASSAPMSIVRTRLSWMYSTAGIIRAVRNELGRAPRVCQTSRSS